MAKQDTLSSEVLKHLRSASGAECDGVDLESQHLGSWGRWVLISSSTGSSWPAWAI